MVGFEALERGNCRSETHRSRPQGSLPGTPHCRCHRTQALPHGLSHGLPHTEASRPRRGTPRAGELSSAGEAGAGRSGGIAPGRGRGRGPPPLTAPAGRPRSPQRLRGAPLPLGALWGGRAPAVGAVSRLSGGHGGTSLPLGGGARGPAGRGRLPLAGQARAHLFPPAHVLPVPGVPPRPGEGRAAWY